MMERSGSNGQTLTWPSAAQMMTLQPLKAVTPSTQKVVVQLGHAHAHSAKQTAGAGSFDVNFTTLQSSVLIKVCCRA